MVCHLGCTHGCTILGCRSLSRSESRTGFWSSHPHRHHCRGRINSSQAQQCTTRKRHYPVDWCLFWSRCGWCHLHLACHLYPAGQVSWNGSRLPENLHCIAIGRCARHPFPYSFPQILCRSSCRTVSFPWSYCHYTGFKEWRERWITGSPIAVGRTDWRSLRLYRGNLRMVERECNQPHDTIR